MNCFEARQDFRSFWRKELAPERRAAFIAHLGDCPKCDAAFRIFALTAPVFHSDTEPNRPLTTQSRMAAASRREGRAYRERRTSAWLSIAAALVLFVTGASAAYFSEETPTETLSDAIHQPSSYTELVSADLPEVSSDFGQ